MGKRLPLISGETCLVRLLAVVLLRTCNAGSPCKCSVVSKVTPSDAQRVIYGWKQNLWHHLCVIQVLRHYYSVSSPLFNLLKFLCTWSTQCEAAVFWVAYWFIICINHPFGLQDMDFKDNSISKFVCVWQVLERTLVIRRLNSGAVLQSSQVLWQI